MRELLENMGARLVGTIEADVVVSQDGRAWNIAPGTTVELWWSQSSNVGYMLHIVAEALSYEERSDRRDSLIEVVEKRVTTECWVQGWPQSVQRAMPTPEPAALPVQAGRVLED